jgi:hypothetical protein
MDIKIKITNSSDGYGVKIFAPESSVFAFAIAELKDIIPAPFRRYEPAAKTWRITEPDLLDEWLDRLRGEYSVEFDGEQQAGPAQPSFNPASPFKTLYLLPNAPPEVVKAAYKALAKIHHPDARGNSEKMIEINRAFEVITQNR